VVHCVGGMASLIGTYFIGPRAGRFGINGEVDRNFRDNNVGWQHCTACRYYLRTVTVCCTLSHAQHLRAKCSNAHRKNQTSTCSPGLNPSKKTNCTSQRCCAVCVPAGQPCCAGDVSAVVWLVRVQPWQCRSHYGTLLCRHRQPHCCGNNFGRRSGGHISHAAVLCILQVRVNQLLALHALLWVLATCWFWLDGQSLRTASVIMYIQSSAAPNNFPCRAARACACQGGI
jgi:hypothetical protein